MNVYVLLYRQEWDEHEAYTRVLGVYLSQEAAERARREHLTVARGITHNADAFLGQYDISEQEVV